MDDKNDIQEIDAQNFMKPVCKVKIGDRFYRRCRVPNTLNYAEVIDIEPTEDDQGPYYIITGKWVNIEVGIKIKKYSSRYLNEDSFVILRKGVDF